MHRHGSTGPAIDAGREEQVVRVPASVMLQRARVVEAATEQRRLYAEAAEAAAAGSMSVGAAQPLEALRERMRALRAELEAERAAAGAGESEGGQAELGLGLAHPEASDASLGLLRRTPPKPASVTVPPASSSSPQRLHYEGSSPVYRRALPVARTGGPTDRGAHSPRTNIETTQQHISARLTAARHRSIADHVGRHNKLRATQQ